MGPKKNYKKSKTDYSTNIGGALFLMIVESPSKCAKIESYLGHRYKCIASKGHIRSLDGLKNIDVNNNYKPTFSIIKEKASHIKWMKEIIEQFPKGNIIIATDDDREGEGIAWHICEVFHLDISKTKRIIFHEITKQAIMSGLDNPSIINMKLVKAQHARQILDILVGFKISPHLWKHIFSSKSNALSAGRCQTPALRLIYDNQISQENCIVEKKYKTTGNFTNKNLDFILGHEFNKEEEVRDFLKLSIGYKHMLSIEKPKESVKAAPKPFNTSKLLQSASNVLHTNPGQTMSICQKLYQNGYITYMRTDSTKYAPPFLDNASVYIKEKYGNEYVGNLDIIKNKDKNNPHEAIRVTNIGMYTISSTNSKEVSMYKLIYKNTIESCMANATYLNTEIRISAPKIESVSKSVHYSHILEMPMFLGWKRFTIATFDQTKELGMKNYLQTIMEKPVCYNSIESTIVVRNSVSHYSESSLIKKLEDIGIGRPSTFATIIDTVQERGYVKCVDIEGKMHKFNEYVLKNDILDTTNVEKVFGNEKSKLQIQQLGVLCIEFLIKYFDTMFSYDYTKNMEDDLDKIANEDNDTWYKICESCTNEITELSKNVKKIKKETFHIDDTNEVLFTQYGVSIKKTNEDKTVTYLKSKIASIDMEKLRKGDYTMEELCESEESPLGIYKDLELHIKKGKFGYYLQYGVNRVSLSSYTEPIKELDYEKALKIIEGQDGNRIILREINTDLSIRNGKYGPYIFFKTSSMKKPKFFPLKKCPYSYETCDLDELTLWIKETFVEGK